MSNAVMVKTALEGLSQGWIWLPLDSLLCPELPGTSRGGGVSRAASPAPSAHRARPPFSTHPPASLVLQNRPPSLALQHIWLHCSSRLLCWLYVHPSRTAASQPSESSQTLTGLPPSASPQLGTNAGSDDRSANIQANAVTPQFSSQLLLKES